MIRNIVLFIFLIIILPLGYWRMFYRKRMDRQIQDYKNEHEGKIFFFYKVDSKFSKLIEIEVLPNLTKDIVVIAIPKEGSDNYKGDWQIRLILFGRRSKLVLPCFMKVKKGKCNWHPFKQQVLDLEQGLIAKSELIDIIKNQCV
jgi:hypothetical protein